MRKNIVVLFVIGLTLLLVACGGKVDDETSEKYITEAKEVVSLLNDAKYEEVHSKFDDAMKAGLPVEAMAELTPIIEGSGNFQEIDKASVEEKDGYYITVLVAEYSNDNRVYTISFNKDDEIAGLHMQ